MLSLRRSFGFVAAGLSAFSIARAQQPKQRYANLNEALQSSSILAGRGPLPSIVWIDGGSRFSYAGVDRAHNRPVVRSYDPATGRDTLLFTGEGVMLPGTTTPFNYDWFQWARDF